jgi:hypothetical protein
MKLLWKFTLSTAFAFLFILFEKILLFACISIKIILMLMFYMGNRVDCLKTIGILVLYNFLTKKIILILMKICLLSFIVSPIKSFGFLLNLFNFNWNILLNLVKILVFKFILLNYMTKYFFVLTDLFFVNNRNYVFQLIVSWFDFHSICK